MPKKTRTGINIRNLAQFKHKGAIIYFINVHMLHERKETEREREHV